MPQYVLKPDPDRDEYVHWSTVVDAPISPVLDRAGIRYQAYIANNRHRRTEDEVLAAIARADQCGTSEPGFGNSKVDRLYMLEQHGLVALADVGHIARLYAQGMPEDALTYVIPDEDLADADEDSDAMGGPW